jgi:plasmid stabilization system protein ParE
MAALDRYVIFFRVLDGVVRIERVLHGVRNLPMLFGTDSDASPAD